MSILFLENLQILSLMPHTYLRKSGGRILLCLRQGDHYLEQITVRYDLHAAFLQFRQTLGNGQPQTIALHVAGFVPSGEPLFQLLR